MNLKKSLGISPIFVRSYNLIFFLCVLGASVVNLPAQEFKAVRDGVEYAEVQRDFGGKAVNINLLRLDLKKVHLDIHHAMDSAVGVETTSSIARRQGAFAAINAGFFRLDKSQFAGDAAGILMIDGQLLSEPISDRIQLLINNDRLRTTTFIARTVVAMTARFGANGLAITGINRERKKDEVVLYTPKFGRTTLTGNDGFEIIVARGKIESISGALGNAVIPPDGFVISASGSFRDALAEAAKKTSPVSISRRWDGLPAEVSNSRANLDIVAGVPQLIKNGRIDITWEQEKASKAFVETRHPRTAVAKLKDGKFLMMTADGRTEQSAGLDLYDLAAYLLELGATDAMNLDGGGSTTMFVDGKVVNHPSDKDGERKVSDVILVTLRKPTPKNNRKN